MLIKLLRQTFSSDISAKVLSKDYPRLIQDVLRSSSNNDVIFFSSKANEQESFSLVPACSCSLPVTPRIYKASLCWIKEKGSQNFLSSETSNKKQFSITVSSSLKIATNITEVIQEFLKWPLDTVRGPSCLSPLLRCSLRIVSTSVCVAA